MRALPNLQAPHLNKGSNRLHCDNVDVTFCDDEKRAKSAKRRGRRASAPSSAILAGFFTFVSDFLTAPAAPSADAANGAAPAAACAGAVVSMRSETGCVAKAAWVAGNGAAPSPPWRLAIEDPLESLGSRSPRDVASTLTAQGHALLVEEFARARRLTASGDVNDWVTLFTAPPPLVRAPPPPPAPMAALHHQSDLGTGYGGSLLGGGGGAAGSFFGSGAAGTTPLAHTPLAHTLNHNQHHFSLGEHRPPAAAHPGHSSSPFEGDGASAKGDTQDPVLLNTLVSIGLGQSEYQSLLAEEVDSDCLPHLTAKDLDEFPNLTPYARTVIMAHVRTLG